MWRRALPFSGSSCPTSLRTSRFPVYDHPKALIFRNAGRLAAGAIEAKVLNSLPSRPVSRSDMLLAHAGETPAGGGRLIRSSLGGRAGVRAPARGPRPGGVRAVARWALPPGPACTPSPRWSACFLFRPTSRGSRRAWGWPRFAPPGALDHAARHRSRGMARPPALAGNRPPQGRGGRQRGGVLGACSRYFLLLRALNPEIYWGEKPMDFSILNILRAVSLPRRIRGSPARPSATTRSGRRWSSS